MEDEPKSLSREVLSDLVWITPMVKLAKRFGVSDVGLRKACKKMEIPLPGKGYWQRPERDRDAMKLPLPALSKKMLRVPEFLPRKPRETVPVDIPRVEVDSEPRKPHPLAAEAIRHDSPSAA